MIGYGAPAGQDAVLDAGEVQRLAHLHGLDWSNPGHIRRIVVRSDGAAPGDASVPTGRLVDALTFSRNLAAGDIVQPTDLVYAKVAAFAVPSDTPRDPESVIGKMVKRPVRSGAAIANHDVSAAQVIKRDDTVQVAFRDEGISLTMQGKAMASAAVGDQITVLNTSSKKVIQAVAVGPDEAVVGPDAEQYRALGPNTPLQFATR
jgi:flagella basal body P-ring formation protein FlgA